MVTAGMICAIIGLALQLFSAPAYKVYALAKAEARQKNEAPPAPDAKIPVYYISFIFSLAALGCFAYAVFIAK